MDIEQLTSAINLPSERNSALQFLIAIIVKTDSRLVESLSNIINAPELIENTHDFACLLEDIGADEFIAPLIEAISMGKPDKSPWLPDYMYALGSLLTERDECWQADEDFVRLIGEWLLSTGGGEISWKASYVLANMVHPATREYLLRGAKDRSLFHQSRNTCIIGMVNHYRDDCLSLLEVLSKDPEPHVRQKVAEIMEWLNNPDNQ